MSSRARPTLVGWKVGSLSSKLASVRYRALLPMMALEAAGVRHRLFSEGHESFLDGLDALVLVKTFTPDDLLLAQLARGRGLPVFIDLCDNVCIEGYGGNRKGISPARMLLSMSAYVQSIVTTTEPLADIIRTHVPGVPVVVIPDGIEETAAVQRMPALLAEAAAREEQGRSRRI
ncbi:MAG TPA: hypothetical protein VNB23_08740, partial [Ramlibacter sp.]|nr:hypothetical protein [Ramlibacter sp.]